MVVVFPENPPYSRRLRALLEPLLPAGCLWRTLEEREDFAALWERLTGGLEELDPAGRAVLAPLGDTLGRCGADRQREVLSAARRRLEELAARLEEDSRRQGRVCQALGLSGGAFLVILLL